MVLFELENSVDLFRKAKHDFVLLDKKVNSYDLFNFLCTVGHLPDWVRCEKGALPRGFNQGAARLAKASKMKAVKALCNRAKHFKKYPDDPVMTVTQGYGAGRYGVGAYGVGEPSYTVEISGKIISVLDLCRDLLNEWETLFEKHGLLQRT